MERTLRPWLERHEQGLVLATAGGVLLLISGAPFACLLAETASVGAGSLAPLFSANAAWLLVRSLALAGATTLLALGIGLPLGVLLGRTDLPFRAPLWLAHAFPMLLPPLLPGLGWFHCFGREGLLGSERSAALLFSDAGVIAILGITFAPVVTSLVALGVRGVDVSLEEAARLVARPFRVALRILLPAASPALALGLIVVFALALSELGVPMLLRVDVFPAAVFARLGGVAYAPGEAFVQALPLLPVALALLALERRFVGRRSFAVLGLRARERSRLPLGRWQPLAAGVAIGVALLSVAPLAALGVRAFGPGGGIAPVLEWADGAPGNSLVAAVLAASGITATGLVVGHALARALRFAQALDALSILAFVAPASVLGIGLITLWNQPSTQIVYGTLAILVLGSMARYAAVGIRVVACAVTQSPVHLEEAAAACGSPFGRRLIRIVLPLHARGVAYAWLASLVFCLRDLESAVLFYPPGGETLTVRIFTLEANGPEAIVAGLALLQIGLIAALLALALLLARGPRT